MPVLCYAAGTVELFIEDFFFFLFCVEYYFLLLFISTERREECLKRLRNDDGYGELIPGSGFFAFPAFLGRFKLMNLI